MIQIYNLLKLSNNIGAGDTGKSTFIKQMKIIHAGGFIEKDRLMYKTWVYNNLIEGIQTIIRAMPLLNIQFEKKRSIVSFILK